MHTFCKKALSWENFHHYKHISTNGLLLICFSQSFSHKNCTICIFDTVSEVNLRVQSMKWEAQLISVTMALIALQIPYGSTISNTDFETFYNKNHSSVFPLKIGWRKNIKKAWLLLKKRLWFMQENTDSHKTSLARWTAMELQSETEVNQWQEWYWVPLQ